MDNFLYSGNNQNDGIVQITYTEDDNSARSIEVWFEEEYYYQRFLKDMENIQVNIEPVGPRVVLPKAFFIAKILGLTQESAGIFHGEGKSFFVKQDNFSKSLRIYPSSEN
jgi:hypothetical protein